MMGDGFPGAAYVGLMRDLGEAAQAQLDKVVREDDRRELGAKAVLLTSASPAQSIADYAREAPADIVVIGTHGRSGLSHLLMGSVAEKVVRIAPCPVLTVRRQEREFVTPDAIQAVAHS
jgi:nucleotide-binding universal stress UspA family protein